MVVDMFGYRFLDGIRLYDCLFNFNSMISKFCYDSFVDYLYDLLSVLFDDDVRRINCLILVDYLLGYDLSEICSKYSCDKDYVMNVLGVIDDFLDRNPCYYSGFIERFSKLFSSDNIKYGDNYLNEESFSRRNRFLFSKHVNGYVYFDGERFLNNNGDTVVSLYHSVGDLEFSSFLDNFIDEFLAHLRMRFRSQRYIDMFMMYLDGFSYADIGKRYGISKQMICKIFKKINKELKKFSQNHKYFQLYDVYRQEIERYS